MSAFNYFGNFIGIITSYTDNAIYKLEVEHQAYRKGKETAETSFAR